MESLVEPLHQPVVEHEAPGRRHIEGPLARDFDALDRAYNYASDPTLPDLAREEPRPWIRPEERRSLDRACWLLLAVYAGLYDRLGDDLDPWGARD